MGELECPITYEPFIDPVLLGPDSFTYERAAIETWIRSGRTMSPIQVDMGKCPLLIKNLTVLDPNRPIFRDPILVAETGLTYEHTELLELIKETICRFKPLILGSAVLFNLTCYRNIVLWKDEYSHERQPFTMPERKAYQGLIKPEQWNEDLSCLDDQKKLTRNVSNTLFTQVEINSGSATKLDNCRLTNCTFSGDSDLNIRFKNCQLISCTLSNVPFGLLFSCPGTTFKDCRLASGSRECIEARGGSVTERYQSKRKNPITVLLSDPTPELRGYPLIGTVMTSSLSSRAEHLLLKYCTNETVHSGHGVNFITFFSYVWARIAGSEHKDEMMGILENLVYDSEYKCLTGVFNLIISVLYGFFDDIHPEVPDSSRISAIILEVGQSISPYDPNLHQELAHGALTEAGYDMEAIEPWLDAIG